MNYKNYLQFIASFMIVLILTIPFYVTSVWATISHVSVTGSDGIEGFVRSQDSLKFVLSASIGNATIAPNQVFLGSNTQFDSCTAAIDGFICTLAYPKTGKQAFEAKPLPYQLNLFKDANKTELDASITGSVLVDALAPQIKLSISKNKFAAQEKIEISYDATDFACNDPACSGKCIGISSIEFSSSAAFKQSVSSNSTSCNVKSSISIEAKQFKDGQNEISAKAIDKFGQASQNVSVKFEIDAVPPEIFDDTFTIIRKGFSISTYGPKEVPVDVLINISAPDLNVNSVAGDLSPLNPAKNLKNIKASCMRTDKDLYTCKWSIGLNPASKSSSSRSKNTSSESSAIVINASDTTGNAASVEISKGLTLDDKGPIVQTLVTNVNVAGKYYAKGSDSITANLDETTGLVAEDVFLYVDGSKIAAHKCDKDANWKCVWKNVNFGSVTKAVLTIKQDTTDILGNAVKDIKTTDVIVDSKPPVIDNINVTAVGSLSEAAPDLFKVGDKIAVVMNVTEANELTALADFSKFVPGAVKVAGVCQKITGDEIGEDQQVCIWLSDPILNPGIGLVKFNLSDPVGNEAHGSYQLTVLGLDTARTPDYWKNEVECSPETVDRQLGSLINQRVYCEVKLQPKSRLASTVFISPAECTAEPSLVKSVETFNNELGSIAPILKFTLDKNKFELNEIKVKCGLGIISKVDNKITKNLEVEEANISIKFYNLPLGEISESVQKEIDKAKESVRSLNKKIGTLSKIVEIYKKICQVLNAIYQVVAVLYVLANFEKDLATSCRASGILNALGICEIINSIGTVQCFGTETASAAADELKTGANVATPGGSSAGGSKTSGIGGGLNKFCEFVTCRQGGLWAKSVGDWINTLPGAAYIGPTKDGKALQPPDIYRSQTYGTPGQARPLSTYLDPRNSLFVAMLYGCIPGIITGVDKFRQIQCLYLDCLQTSVARDGLPISVCEKQKDYANCKYVRGEIFQVIPYTAMFDHFANIIKNALSNPFNLIGIVFSISCSAACPAPTSVGYKVCRGAKLVAAVGDAAESVKSIIDQGSFFKVRQDYCSRLNLDEESPESTTQTSQAVPRTSAQQTSGSNNQQNTQQNQQSQNQES